LLTQTRSSSLEFVTENRLIEKQGGFSIGSGNNPCGPTGTGIKLLVSDEYGTTKRYLDAEMVGVGEKYALT
jgi:hypothetical protein